MSEEKKPMSLDERVFRYLAACPPAISGQEGHTQTFIVACALVNGFGMNESEALQYLKRYNDRCQPPWDEADLARKVQQAAAAQHRKVKGHLIGGNGFNKEDFKNSSFPAREQKKPEPTLLDPSTSIEIFLKGFSCTEADIYDASPIKPSDDYTQDGCLLVEHLFKAGEQVSYVTDFSMKADKGGKEKAVPMGYGLIRDKGEVLDEWALGMPQSDCGGWMRMNPMLGGISDKNVTSYRHILLEFDSIPLDLQLNLIARIPLPISCVLTSGGRSIHAWVKSDSMDAVSYKDDAGMLLKMLSRFGLDAKNKNPSRLSRLPGVMRKLGANGDGRQRLLYLNPNPSQKPML